MELLSSLGQARVATGGWSATEAEGELLRARASAARLSDNEPLVSVLLALATLYELRGEFSRAHEMAEECLRLAPSGSAEHELESSELLACNLFHQGSFARALELAERGVELFESGEAPGAYTTFPATLGDNAGVSCHDWAGLALWFLGRPDSALERASHALGARARAEPRLLPGHGARPDGRRAPVPARAGGGARVGRGDDRRGAAARLRLPRGHGTRPARLGALAPGRHAAGHPRDHRGLAASRGTGARMDDPHYLALLAEAHLKAGDVDAGCAAVAEALELAARERSLFYEPELHRLDGALHAVAGDLPGAELRLRRGLARAREQSSATLELRIATDLARLLPDPAAAAEARAMVAAAYAKLTEGTATRDLREAAALLGNAQLITPDAVSASTSVPSTTR